MAAEPDEQAMLGSLVAAVRQEALAMETLPQLMATEREKLIKEICDRTTLTPDQASTVLDDIAPMTPSSAKPDSSRKNNIVSTTGRSNVIDRLSWRQLRERR